MHLLVPLSDSQGELAARCGALLRAAAIQHDQPPPGAPYELCRLAFLADFGVPR